MNAKEKIPGNWIKAESSKAVILSSLLVFFSIYFSFFVLALPDDYSLKDNYLPHKQNTNFNLTISSSTATTCNLSYIQYPDGSTKLKNIILTKNGNTFFTTVASTNYSSSGSVCHGIVCNNATFLEVGSVCRNITPSGFTSTATFFFIFIIIIALVFLIGTVLRNAWIMTLGSILVIIFGFFIIINGVDVIKDTQTTWAIGIIVWALGIYFLYLSAEEQLKAWN